MLSQWREKQDRIISAWTGRRSPWPAHRLEPNCAQAAISCAASLTALASASAALVSTVTASHRGGLNAYASSAGVLPLSLPFPLLNRLNAQATQNGEEFPAASTPIDGSDAESGGDTQNEPEEPEEGGTDEVEIAVGRANGAPKDPAKVAFLKVLQRAKEGDRKAFEEIYQLYHRRIYNAVYGMLSDADDAQDVTQDVFIRLHDALPTLRADEAFSTYLYRIALNLCRDRARRKKRVRFQSMDTPRADSEGDIEPMEFPDLGKLPEELLTGDELQLRVREAVQTLSQDHKAVIMMHHFQGMEVNDIAQILEVPSGTVKSRLARGRDQLHRKLRSYLGV